MVATGTVNVLTCKPDVAYAVQEIDVSLGTGPSNLKGDLHWSQTYVLIVDDFAPMFHL